MPYNLQVTTETDITDFTFLLTTLQQTHGYTPASTDLPMKPAGQLRVENDAHPDKQR